MAEDRGDFFRFDYNFNPMSHTSPIPFNFIRQYFKIVDLVSNGPLSPNSFACVSAQNFSTLPRSTKEKARKHISRIAGSSYFSIIRNFYGGGQGLPQKSIRPSPSTSTSLIISSTETQRERQLTFSVLCHDLKIIGDVNLESEQGGNEHTGFFQFFFFQKKTGIRGIFMLSYQFT